MEKDTRSPAEKAYHNRDAHSPAKEDSDPEDVPKPEKEKDVRDKPVPDPTDCILKIKTSGPDSRRECPQDELDSPASSSRPPPSPQYRHILPEPHWSSHRAAEPQHAHAPYHRSDHGQSWHPHPDDSHNHYTSNGDHESQNVRLPSIAALLTEPYTPHQSMSRMAGYSSSNNHNGNDREWPPSLPVPDRYPPMVAALPLDDSRARTPQPMPQRKRGRLPKETTDFLKAWLHSHSAHPYPSEIEKKQMCHATGLSMSQVSNWMINGRRRILGPSYLSTSRSNPHGSPPVTLSSPPVMLSSPSVMLTSPSLMLHSPPGGQTY